MIVCLMLFSVIFQLFCLLTQNHNIYAAALVWIVGRVIFGREMDKTEGFLYTTV